MADPFTQCASANKAGFRCWLCLGHRGGIHETHPSERRKSRDAGASPVWSDAGHVTGPGEVAEDAPAAGAATDSRPEQNYRIEAGDPVLLGGGGHALAELDLSPGRPDYVTADGVEVWMERKRQKTRFLDRHGSQVGPVHRNLAPAVIWARAQGWRDPSLPQWFNDGVIAEVSAGGAGVDEAQGLYGAGVHPAGDQYGPADMTMYDQGA
jgi:hypothetical protein